MSLLKDKTIKWIYAYAKNYILYVVLLAAVGGIIAFGFILLALVSSKLLDIATGKASGSAYVQCLFLFALIFMQAVLNILYSNIWVRVYGKIEIKIKSGVFTALIKKQYLEITKMHSGEVLNRLTSDTKIVVDGIVTIIPQAISMGTKVFAGIFVLAKINFLFAFFITSLGAFMYFASRFYRKHFKYLHKEVQKTDGKTRSFMQESVENIVVIKAFMNEGTIRQKLDEYQKVNYNFRIKLNGISNIANTASYVMMTSGYFLVLAWGAFQISAGNMTFGTLTAFLQIIEQIKAPFKNMSGLIPKYYSMIASAERLMELEFMEDEVIVEEDISSPEFYSDLKNIVFEDVSFLYEKNHVLKEANLVISKGEIIALVGKSGAGKSTVIRLLLGLISAEKGSVYFETGSRNRFIDAGSRSLFAYVPQGNMIISGTIRENVTFSNSNTSEDKLIYAAKIACIYDFIRSLPDGFDTMVAERGIGLSEGQAQRLAIARAILSDSPILLLDECTSALDERTEAEVLNNIRILSTKTVICISHKLAAINSCDRVIEIKNKKFMEDGIYG